MDIDGGMKIDVFDSMAEGVTGAAIILCFMSDEYENSQNCKLELKFARQTGVPINSIREIFCASTVSTASSCARAMF